MLDRRQFLSAAAAGAALTLVRTVAAERDTTLDAPDLAHPELLVALGPQTVREIGKAYRRLVPDEPDWPTLQAALRSRLRAASVSGEDPVRADFAAGRVIVIRDWMLSLTEARQCALFSLLPA